MERTHFSKVGYLQARAIGDVEAAQLSQHGQVAKATCGRSGQGSAAPQAHVPQVLQRRQLTNQLISYIGLQLQGSPTAHAVTRLAAAKN